MYGYIKNLKRGQRFVIVPNTVYVCTGVNTWEHYTGVTYTIEGSHIQTETTFTRPSLTTVEFL